MTALVTANISNEFENMITHGKVSPGNPTRPGDGNQGRATHGGKLLMGLMG